MITAKILADSINSRGVRLTSFLLTYPRFIHSELMTHRVFSRNAASSRARSVKSILQEVRENPVIPSRWGAEKKGMQSGDELAQLPAWTCQFLWRNAALFCASMAEMMVYYGLHKSLVNRILEPWTHITTIVTATDFGNFFELRANPAAQPEFQELAYKMLNCYLNSTVSLLGEFEWHIPFVYPEERDKYNDDQLLRISVARCCWISYSKHGREDFDYVDAQERHDSCIKLKHMSPLEHQAQATSHLAASNFDIGGEDSGWLQYRKLQENEMAKPSRDKLKEILASKPDWIILDNYSL